MRAHVAGASETGKQVGLHIRQRNKHGVVGGLCLRPVVEHMGMGVNEAGQNRRLTEVNHARPGWDLDLTLGPYVHDSIALDEDELFAQHPAGLAVKQAARADGHGFWSRRTFVIADRGRAYARLRTHASPSPLAGLLRGPSLNTDDHGN